MTYLRHEEHPTHHKNDYDGRIRRNGRNRPLSCNDPPNRAIRKRSKL
jgi:hypothetical protein